MKEDWKWIFASEIVFMVQHNERICRSFCMFTLLLIKFLMHVSRDLHRNAEPDLLMFRDSMHLVLQNAWNGGHIKEYDRKYHRLGTSEKLAVIFYVRESIAWRQMEPWCWTMAESFWCSSVGSKGTVCSHSSALLCLPVRIHFNIGHSSISTLLILTPSPHWMYWRWRHGVTGPWQEH